jgi:hypothetical protein
MSRIHTSYFFALLLAALLVSPGIAQTGNSSLGRSGSIYSSLGVGFPVDPTSAALQAQGILGITNVNRQTSGLANPALWGDAVFSQAATGLQLTRANITDNNATASNVNLETAYLHLLLPIKPGKFGVSASLYPVTRSQFKALNTNTISLGVDSTASYNNDLKSLGGINKFEIGFGIEITKNFTVGYAPSIAFLSLTESEYLTFETTGFEVQNQERNINGSAIAHRFGLTGTFSALLRENDRLSIGATINLPYTLKAKQSLSAIKSVQGVSTIVDLSSEVDIPKGDITMPFEMAFGLGYSPSPLLNFSGELQLQEWSGYNNELNISAQEVMNNRMKIGFGGQYHPYRSTVKTFLSELKYSAGVTYDTGHLSIDNQNISTLWINSGIGIPSRNGTFIDFSLRYGMRGQGTIGLFEENIWSLGFTVNLTELMFVRPKLR